MSGVVPSPLDVCERAVDPVAAGSVVGVSACCGVPDADCFASAFSAASVPAVPDSLLQVPPDSALAAPSAFAGWGMALGPSDRALAPLPDPCLEPESDAPPLAAAVPVSRPPAPTTSRVSLAVLSTWSVDRQLVALEDALLGSERPDQGGSSVPTLVARSACSSSDWDFSSVLATNEGNQAEQQRPPSMFLGARAERMQQLAEESFVAIPDVLPPDAPFEAVHRPSSAFIESSACPVRDPDGRVVQWPWETPNAVFGGAGYALPKQQRLAHRTDALRLKGMNASMASGDMGRGSTGVNHWRKFCAQEDTPHDRPIDPSSPLWVKLEEEMLAMQFCCALVQDRGVAPDTAACYFGQVQGWHSKEHGIKLAAGMKLARLPAMLKGLRRVLGANARAVRRGVAPAALKLGMDAILDRSVPAHANIRAALALALQGLLRSAEYACDSGVKFNPAKHLTRADIVECSAERLVVMMLPCKNMRHLTGKTCPLVIGSGGELVDAVAEVRNMMAVDPVSPLAAGSTPLFRDPATGEPLRTAHMRQWVRDVMRAAGVSDPSHFGTHSLRIGGATALFAAGADPTVIRTMGRWSSDCYRLYVRACFESTLKWSRLAGSTQVHDLAGEFDEVDYY